MMTLARVIPRMTFVIVASSEAMVTQNTMFKLPERSGTHAGARWTLPAHRDQTLSDGTRELYGVLRCDMEEAYDLKVIIAPKDRINRYLKEADLFVG